MVLIRLVVFLVLLSALCIGVRRDGQSLAQRTLAAVFLGSHHDHCALPTIAQKTKCLKEPDLQNVLTYANRLAQNMCRIKLSEKKWSCPNANATSFKIMSRETAFQQAMYTAALGYSVAIACGRSQLNCSCAPLTGLPDTEHLVALDMCPDNIPYGVELTESLLHLDNRSKLIYPVHTHNAALGLKVLQMSTVKNCTCQFEVCFFNICYQQLRPFIVIYKVLRQLYNTAVHIAPSNNAYYRILRQDQLWYTATTSSSPLKCRPRGQACRGQKHCTKHCCSRSFSYRFEVHSWICRCRGFPSSKHPLCAVCRKSELLYNCD